MMRGAALAAAAALLLLAAVGILVPAPTRSLLLFSVGAPELSPWLLAAATLVALLAVRKRETGAARVAILFALCAAAIALQPLRQIPRTSRQVDDRLRAAFGADYVARMEPVAAAGLRQRNVDVRELFTGISKAPVATKDVLYPSSRGDFLTVRIYQPAAAGGPVIVQLYGGAWVRGSAADDPVMAGYLASRGYVVFAVSYQHAPGGRWPAQRQDVETALAWVRAHARDYGGDTSRIALVGRSAGAHLALVSAYSSPGPDVRGVISLYGPTDLTRGYRELPAPDPIGVRTALETLMGGGPDVIPEEYLAASPVSYASRRQPPTLQIIGSRDHVVLPRFVRSLDEQLRAAGNVSILIELPWADHAFDAVPFGPGGQLAIYAAERFLAATLGPRIAARPGKP